MRHAGRSDKVMKRLRGAVIGCGFISEFHLRGWTRIPEVEICVLVDPDRARAESRRTQLAPGARVYDSLPSAMAGESLDFVDILTPPWLHREHCLQAAVAGLHIICQKPLCDRLDEAESLVTALKDFPRRFVVHENHRFRPWFGDVLQLARNGFFGKVRYVELQQHDPTEPPQKIDTEVERGILLQYGVHLADMMVALLGEPTRVLARMQCINPRVRGESIAHAVFEYPDSSATITVSWKPGGIEQGHAVVIGDQGEAIYEGIMTPSASARFRLCRGCKVVRDETRIPRDDYLESFFRFQRVFVDSVLRDAPPPPSAAENLRSLRAIFAAYQSALSGAPVALAGFDSPSGPEATSRR